MAFLSGYTKRWAVTIDATKVLSTQTNFPVYVDLSDMPASFWSTVASGGGDIRVTQSNGTTEVAREVVSCDTGTDTGELHFLGNSVDATTDTVYYIYANGTSADYAVTDTYGRNAVWVDYEMVNHFQEETTTTSIDSTDGATATASRVGMFTLSSKIGGGVSKTTNGIITQPYSSPSNSSRTYQQTFWMKSSDTNTGFIAISAPSAGGPDNHIFILSSEIGARSMGGTSLTGIGTVNQYRDGNWYKMSLIKTGASTAKLRINGVDVSAVNVGNFDRGTEWWFTARPGGSPTQNDFLGDLDEWRYRASSVSDDWDTTEYNNQSSPSTFYTVGAEETDGGGGAAGNPLFAFGGM